MWNSIAVFTASILLVIPSGAKATMRRASAGNKFIAYIKYKSHAKRLIRSFLKPKQLQIFGRKNIERGDWLIPRKNSIAENPLECRNGWSSNVIFMKPGNLSRLHHGKTDSHPSVTTRRSFGIASCCVVFHRVLLRGASRRYRRYARPLADRPSRDQRRHA